MLETKQRGNLTELQCMTACIELGYVVSIPFGEDSRYDFIVDIHDRLYKIQCKTSTEITDENGVVTSIMFKTTRQSGNSANQWTRTKYLPNEIDYFATSYKGKCYLVPISECSNEKTLRIMPTKNNQLKGVSLLDNYELSNVVRRM